MEYDNTNRGVIFKNEKKASDKHPDYQGTINVDGKDKAISLWVKDSKAGKKFFSVAISEPYVKQEEKQVVSKDLEDGLPF